MKNVSETLAQLKYLSLSNKVEDMTEKFMKSCEEAECTFDEAIELLGIMKKSLEGIVEEYPDKRNELIKIVKNI